MNRLTIKTRLIVLVAVLLGFLMLAVAANLVRSNDHNRQFGSLYRDRVLPMVQLSQINDAYRVGVVDTAQKVRDGLMPIEKALEVFRAERARVDQLWQAYLATELLPEEKTLADQLAAQMQQDKPQLDKLHGLLERKEVQNLWMFSSSELYPAVEPLLATLHDLSELQARTVQATYESNQSAFPGMLARNLAGFAVALALGLAVAWTTIRAVSQGLGAAVTLAERVAEGDLRTQIEAQGRNEIAALLNALQRMNQGLAGMVREVRDSADAIGTGSGEIAHGNADLSQRTETQASNLEETAASMEELTATVRQNADTAQEASRLAAQAADAARQGGDAVARVVDTMSRIAGSSSRIADITGTIDGIAFQTNILALNAAVEAARAGEQGRGFAVVASEVRSLAQRSAEAAREIKTLIEESASTVREGGNLVADAGERMQAIVGQVQRVHELITEISDASAEQTTGITQVGEAVMQLDQVTQQNAALVEQSAAAAESLKQQAGRLNQLVATFQLPAA